MDVVILFCPSFTQSERFLQTDQLITRLQVVVMTNFIRMLTGNVIVNVFKSDAVIWWAAILRILGSPPFSIVFVCVCCAFFRLSFNKSCFFHVCSIFHFVGR